MIATLALVSLASLASLAAASLAALELAAVLAGLALLIPSTFLAAQCVVAVLAPLRCRLASRAPGRVAVVVPAHDEAHGIAATVTELRRQLRPGDRLLVVADNCTDRTAELARAAGAEVVERHDPDRRGKGHALAHGIRALAEEPPPEAVVIVDADCRLSAGAALTLAGHTLATGRPIQADYVLEPADDDARSAVSALAFVVRNRVRPRALAALGLPCQLTGSGMALPWSLAWERAREGRLGGGHLVEDLVLGVETALRGLPPLACVRAHVRSQLAICAAAAAQRTRWEHGHLAVVRSHGGVLVREAVRQRRLDLLVQALDLAVPPLALLVTLLVSLAGASALATWAWGASRLPLTLALVDLLLLAVGLGAAWWTFGREVLRPRHLLAVPAYVAWKLPIYARLVLRGAERRWVRTQRPLAAATPVPATTTPVDHGEVT